MVRKGGCGEGAGRGGWWIFQGKSKNNSLMGYIDGERYRRWRETCKSRARGSMDETVYERGGGIDKTKKQEGRKVNDTWGRRGFD